METSIFTYIGVATVSYLFVYKLMPWLEGERNRKDDRK